MKRVDYHDLQPGDYVYSYWPTSDLPHRYLLLVSEIVTKRVLGANVTVAVCTHDLRCDGTYEFAISVPAHYVGITELEQLFVKFPASIDPDMCFRETDVERGLRERLNVLREAKRELRERVADEMAAAVRDVLDKHDIGAERIFRGTRNNCCNLIGRTVYDEEIVDILKKLHELEPKCMVDGKI